MGGKHKKKKKKKQKRQAILLFWRQERTGMKALTPAEKSVVSWVLVWSAKSLP